MSENKIRVLAIAPYKAMENQIKRIAAGFPYIDLTTYTGDRDQGIMLAQANYHSNYDIILSRGGTATLLRGSVALPIVEIETSVSDILASLKLAGIKDQRFAVIGYENVTKPMHLLRSIHNYNCEIFVIRDESDLDSIFEQVRSGSFSTIFGDVAGYTFGRERGFRSYLITSGDTSIREALGRISVFRKMNLQLTRDNYFFRTLLQSRATITVVLSLTGQLIYTSTDMKDQEVIEILRRNLKEMDFSRNTKLHFQLHSKMYNVYTRTISDNDNTYVVFDYTVNQVAAGSQSGIQYCNVSDVKEQYSKSIYGVMGFSPSALTTVRQYSGLMSPIFLTAPQGCGKTQFGRLLYMNSPFSNKPYIQIDSNLMDKKSWNFLLEHHRSPLFDSDNTIYFGNLDSASEEDLTRLLAVLISSQTSERNRIIVSFAEQEGHVVSETAMKYKNNLYCIPISLPPLREDPEMIRNSSSMYLNWLNMNGDRFFSGIDQDALTLLSSFSWPQNYYQFQRVMSMLYHTSEGATITSEDVKRVLENETSITAAAYGSLTRDALDLSKPLNEIERDIANILLRKNNGNRTLTAQSLSISRTTLWKLLKE
ncbi:MAG: PrpR N-terminal domain-containing protein [Lachnospiraceae bacterium]|nr:PrpR N-terminal domain-containing protein [Lachnospiraceae bacterium]